MAMVSLALSAARVQLTLRRRKFVAFLAASRTSWSANVWLDTTVQTLIAENVKRAMSMLYFQAHHVARTSEMTLSSARADPVTRAMGYPAENAQQETTAQD